MRSVVEAGVSARSLQIDYDEDVCYQAEVKLWEYARQAGAAPMWDFQPFQDASKQYLRSGNSPTHVKGLARSPFVSPKRPDHPRAE